tara:strand:- start:173 stop:343 length:171 start_codon:yes stop_codon:yes gene_type:complete
MKFTTGGSVGPRMKKQSLILGHPEGIPLAGDAIRGEFKSSPKTLTLTDQFREQSQI